MANKLFREKAIERLSTPERLDTLMQVTTPRAWLALAATGMILLAAVFWGFFGRVSDTVQGTGIVLHEGGIYGIQALGTGVVEETSVNPGDTVARDQLVARIAQPALVQDLEELRNQLQTLQETRNQASALVDESTRLRLESISHQRVQSDARLSAAREELTFLESRVREDKEALDLGLITAADYQNTLQQLAEARQAVAGAQAQVSDLESQIPTLQNQSLQAILNYDDRIAQLRDRIASTQEELEMAGRVRSPYSGRVIEVLVDDGETVTAGSQVVLVELPDRPLRAMVFVPPEGKRIQPGMTARLSPSGFSPEEFGFMLGSVDEVSELPASPALINRYLRNQSLVQDFTSRGNTYVVHITMETDSATFSGFKWTSRSGPQVQIGSGTLLTGFVSVQDHRPITLVIPALRRWLGI
jgi:HlyD family secretion protein